MDNKQWRGFLNEGKQIVEGKKDYQIHHSSTTSATNEALAFAEKNGYEVDEHDWDSQVTHGGSTGRARPAVEKTKSFHIGLIDKKTGKPSKKLLHFQIYGLPSGNFELTMYIS